jgi:integrase
LPFDVSSGLATKVLVDTLGSNQARNMRGASVKVDEAKPQASRGGVPTPRWGRWPASASRSRDLAFKRWPSGAPTRVLQRILSVAKDRGKIKTNPCERGGRLYEADRSDKLWTDDIIKQFFEGAPKHLHLPLMLALWTGQRRSDLLRLPWSAYNGERIRLRRKKGKRGGAPRHDTPQPPQSRLLINDTIYCPWDEMTR